MVDPYTGKQVKEGKSKAPLVAASESVAVGKPWSYALRGLCILPARPVVMILLWLFKKCHSTHSEQIVSFKHAGL